MKLYGTLFQDKINQWNRRKLCLEYSIIVICS